MKKNEAVERAVKIFGSQVKLARAINVSRAQVWQWLNNTNRVSSKKAINIEDITNRKVTCEELRPDINWSVLRK